MKTTRKTRLRFLISALLLLVIGLVAYLMLRSPQASEITPQTQNSSNPQADCSKKESAYATALGMLGSSKQLLADLENDLDSESSKNAPNQAAIDDIEAKIKNYKDIIIPSREAAVTKAKSELAGC